MTKRFEKLDTDGSGGISMEELMKLPELKGNPLAKRVYTVMGKYVNNTPERLDVFQYTPIRLVFWSLRISATT